MHYHSSHYHKYLQVQAKSARDQEMHRHFDREGIFREARWSQRYLQLPRLKHGKINIWQQTWQDTFLT